MTAVASSAPPKLPGFASILRPVIDRVAHTRASVHSKLRAGFLLGAVLLVGMAVVSLAVQAHIADRVTELTVATDRLDRLRQMYYLITAQSHYRTMSLLTHDDSYVQSIAQSKADFLNQLDALDRISADNQKGPLARIREANQRFATSGAQVLALYQAGQIDQALQLHLAEEHPISHEIEQPIVVLLDQAEQQVATAQAVVASDQRLLTGVFIAFSIVSLVTALLLGFVLSWSFLLPLETIHRALARIAGGQFDHHVELPNRDEFGALAQNVNVASRELATMYQQLEDLNRQLRGTNADLLTELRARVEELDRSRGLITEAEERLRRDIAEMLHSRVQNRLLMLWYRLQEVQETIGAEPAAAREMLDEIRQQLDDIREQDVRELSHRLHPSIIRAGLLPALETLVEQTPPVEIHLDVDEEVRALDDPVANSLPETVRLTAYRVVEEALGNVVKHAAASHVQIRLGVSARGLELIIVDDGRGFDQQRLKPGLGIGSIAAHVGRIGGTWSIHSAVGKGTHFSATLPYSVEQVQHSLGAEAPLGEERDSDATGDAVVGGHR